MATMQWRLGDRVLHAGKPEWGAGEVRSAESTLHEGRPAQRLTIRFDRAGVKTLSTAFAELRAAADEPPIPPANENGEPLNHAEAIARMTAIPEAAGDPFRTRRARLQSTLDLYRFTGTGASLLDWAAMQSGLKDPLNRFNRHELEELFARFRSGLDNHLKRLIHELRREDPAAIAQLAAAAPPEAQQVLRRIDGGR